MLFTVVESRDARLVAESKDRKTTLVLEGTGVSDGVLVGHTLGVSNFLVTGDPQPAVTHDLSDEVEEDAADVALIAETLAESDERIPFEQVKAELGLAEPTPEQ